MSQIAFDIDTMIHELDLAALPRWEGMPLGGFTASYYSPAEHDAALERRRLEDRPYRTYRHTWTPALCLDMRGETEDGHTFIAYTADTRCNCKFDYRTVADFEEAGRCRCVGDLLTKAICAECRWHNIGTERRAVEAWMDHAFPGWQALPRFPIKLRGPMGSRQMTDKREAWLEANYPQRFRTALSPILTSREPIGSRHVPGYSPYGGFDMGIITRTPTVGT